MFCQFNNEAIIKWNPFKKKWTDLLTFLLIFALATFSLYIIHWQLPIPIACLYMYIVMQPSSQFSAQ